jgi:NDP-sugar pyrophosphorylase family protein
MELKSNVYIIILAAGYATRLRPLSNRIPKPLIEINGKPLISRIIFNFKNSGFRKFCVLVGYKQEKVIAEVSKFKDLDIDFVEQKEIVGMADAISLSVKHINRYDKNVTNFFITAADLLISHKKILKLFSLLTNSNADMVLSLMKSDDPEIAKGHGNVKISIRSNLNEDDDIHQGLEITDVIEKPQPQYILSNYYSLPLYLFNQKIAKYLRNIRISERGEKEFQDVIKNAITAGEVVRGLRIIDGLIDKDTVGKYHLTDLRDIIRMNNRFSSGENHEIFKGKSLEYFKPVHVNSRVEIGKKVIFGPHVIIGINCQIGNHCELSETIVLNNSTIGNFCKLNWCIIDENVIVPDNFHGEESFITTNEKNQIEIINI